MEGLRSRRQTAHDDTARNGVLASLLPARAAEGLRENPLFWFPREPNPRALPPALPATAGERSPAALQFLGDYLQLALPQLRRRNDCYSQTHRWGTLAVHLLRYLLKLRPTAGHRRACRTRARSCARPSPNHIQAAFRGLQFKQLLSNRDSFQRSYPDILVRPATHLNWRHFRSGIQSR